MCTNNGYWLRETGSISFLRRGPAQRRAASASSYLGDADVAIIFTCPRKFPTRNSKHVNLSSRTRFIAIALRVDCNPEWTKFRHCFSVSFCSPEFDTIDGMNGQNLPIFKANLREKNVYYSQLYDWASYLQVRRTSIFPNLGEMRILHRVNYFCTVLGIPL